MKPSKQKLESALRTIRRVAEIQQEPGMSGKIDLNSLITFINEALADRA